MIVQVDTSVQALPASGEVTRSRWYRMRILRATPGATVAWTSPKDSIKAYAGALYGDPRGYAGLWIPTGNTYPLVLEYTDDPSDHLQPAAAGAVALDGLNNQIVAGAAAAGAPPVTNPLDVAWDGINVRRLLTDNRGQLVTTPNPSLAPVVVVGAANIAATAQIAITGGQYATVQFTSASTGIYTANAQYSIDGGNNWLTAPYAKNLSAGQPNPAVTLWAGANGTYEIPLPGNTTHFRIAGVSMVGGSVTVTLTPGAVYVPGVQVTAVLYDVTSGVNALNNTGIMDMSGWGSAQIIWTSGGATNATPTFVPVLDSGVDSPAAAIGPGIGPGGYSVLGRSFGAIAQNGGLFKRMRFQVSAVVAQQSYLRIEASR